MGAEQTNEGKLMPIQIELINQGRDWLDYFMAFSPALIGFGLIWVAWRQLGKASQQHEDTLRANNVRQMKAMRTELLYKQRQRLLERIEQATSVYFSKFEEIRYLARRIRNGEDEEQSESVEKSRVAVVEASGALYLIINSLPHNFAMREAFTDEFMNAHNELAKHDFSEEGEKRLLAAITRAAAIFADAFTEERIEIEEAVKVEE